MKKKESLYEGLFKDLAGSNKMGFVGYDYQAAIKAQFEKELIQKAKRAFNNAWATDSVDLNKPGEMGSAPAQQPASQTGQAQPADQTAQQPASQTGQAQPADQTAQPGQSAQSAQSAAQPGQAQPADQTAQLGQTGAQTAAGTKARPGAAQNQARLQQDVATINNAITGIVKSINATNLPNQKAMLAREIINVMADNKKARPEAWQNAYGTAKKVLLNVGKQIDATMPKGRQNVTRDLIAALNAGQTRNQQATGISKSKAKVSPKLAKSSTVGRLGKAAPKAKPAAVPMRKVAESRTVDSLQFYFLNSLLENLELTWDDVGFTITETKDSNSYSLCDSKIYSLNKLLESAIYEFEGRGESPSNIILDVINDQLHPLNLDKVPKHKERIMYALNKWQQLLKKQIEQDEGEYTGKFNSEVEKAFDLVIELASQIAMQSFSSRGKWQ